MQIRMKNYKDVMETYTRPATNHASTEESRSLCGCEARNWKGIVKQKFVEFWDFLLKLTECKERSIDSP